MSYDLCWHYFGEVSVQLNFHNFFVVIKQLVSEFFVMNQLKFHNFFIVDICECEPNYFGGRCQYKNECEQDEDCQNGGR